MNLKLIVPHIEATGFVRSSWPYALYWDGNTAVWDKIVARFGEKGMSMVQDKDEDVRLMQYLADTSARYAFWSTHKKNVWFKTEQDMFLALLIGLRKTRP